MRRRAARRRWHAPLATVFAAVLVMGLSASAAFANAAAPTAEPLHPGSVVINANGTVTVNATGTWLWAFGTESATTAGLDATVNHPCDSRTGVGWGIVWNDPTDPGIPETYTTKHGTTVSLTVHVGSQGHNPLNGDSSVEYDHRDPCGHFVQTNVPRPGDGYDTGVWSGSHVYPSVASLPTAVCVITYDLGFGRPPTPHRLNFDNNDNSVQWALFKSGVWDTNSMGTNCTQLPPPVHAPPKVVPTTVPVKTVSHTTPPPSPTVVPATVPVKTSPKSPGVLAFTGFGPMGQLLALLGMIFVLVGLIIYFFDVRKAMRWLLGW
jgi:hypothetical protein